MGECYQGIVHVHRCLGGETNISETAPWSGWLWEVTCWQWCWLGCWVHDYIVARWETVGNIPVWHQNGQNDLGLFPPQRMTDSACRNHAGWEMVWFWNRIHIIDEQADEWRERWLVQLPVGGDAEIKGHHKVTGRNRWGEDREVLPGTLWRQVRWPFALFWLVHIYPWQSQDKKSFGAVVWTRFAGVLKSTHSCMVAIRKKHSNGRCSSVMCDMTCCVCSHMHVDPSNTIAYCAAWRLQGNLTSFTSIQA